MLIAALLSVQAVPVACTTTDAALPPALAGWTEPGATLSVGKAVTLTPASDRTAGVTFSVARAAIYGLALDQKAWIDVFEQSKPAPLKSSAHGHGPQCSTIRKIVRFNLSPGRYRVVVSKIEKPTARLMLTGG